MFVQVVTHSLEGISEDEYLDVAHRLAPRTADLSGLLAKIWLENPGGNRYGAIYFWDDLESMERFSDSDLFEGRVPEFTDLNVEEFGVLENLTAETQPVLEILAPPRRATAAPAAPSPSAIKAAQAPPRKRTPPPRKTAASTAERPAKSAAKAATATKTPKASKATKAPKASKRAAKTPR